MVLMFGGVELTEQRHLSVGNAVRDDLDGQHIPHHFFANCCSGPFFQIAAMDHFLCRVLSWIISMQMLFLIIFCKRCFLIFWEAVIADHSFANS